MGAQNFNFAYKFSQNVFSARNFAFLDDNSLKIEKNVDNFPAT